MPADSPFERRIHARLARLASDDLLRTPSPPAGIDLSSNDYLNLASDPRVRAALVAGVERHGCGSTGSRLLRGERLVFRAMEERFAAFKGTDRALYFSSGYLANLAVLTAGSEPGDVIFSDALNHASLIDGARLSHARKVVFPHNDVTALAQLLQGTPCSGVRFLVVESVYSMDGDFAPLAEYTALCRAHGAVLVVDEAHAVGIFGERGSGLIEAAGIAANECLSVNTAGKALGVAGALVAGPSWAVEFLVQRARPFVFSTAPPPALAEALQASLDIVATEPERRRRLRTLSIGLRKRLVMSGIEPRGGSSQIVPVLLGDNARAVRIARELGAAGFDVRAIRPPSVPPGTARLRVSVNAGLSESALDRFVELLADIMSADALETGASAAVPVRSPAAGTPPQL
jgi:8-amino-7-oxononanoate synthase